MVDNRITSSSYRLNEWAHKGDDPGQTSNPDNIFMFLFLAQINSASQSADLG